MMSYFISTSEYENPRTAPAFSLFILTAGGGFDGKSILLEL